MSKTRRKYIVAAIVIVVLAAGISVFIKYRNKDVVLVQTGKVAQMETLVQIVSASGEIKPLKYINITANSFGRIVEIVIKEGDHVKEGDLLLKQESVQSSADLRSAEAFLQQLRDDAEGAEAAFRSSEAILKTSQADLVRAQADHNKAKVDFDRMQNLFKEGLVSRAQLDETAAAFAVTQAQVDSAQARVQQSEAQVKQADKARISASSRIVQQKGVIARIGDQVSKTIYLAPLTGVITNLPVHVGESAVPGIQNAIGSNLMTLADLSVITAEVKVDETDIVNVRLGQDAEVSVDAVPNKIFRGKVTEVGSSALTRSGQAAGSGITNTTSQEAKDFKVVVTLTDPTDQLKPGLSTTAKITTATRNRVLTIPIQALTIRELDQEGESNQASLADPNIAEADGSGEKKIKEGAGSPLVKAAKKKERQGVFLARKNQAIFVPVSTGITGQTEIEVLSGLKEGDEIVTGSYKTLRTLKSGAQIKIDNKAVENEEKKD
ncbi:MAG: efflux RND transporter periplasmic adaptor subunit [Terriglobia bacterium]